MRKEPLVIGEYYHIYNRGVDKREIFNNSKDLERFKESIKQFNQIEGIGSLEMYHKSERASMMALGSHPKPLVAIVAFCINPNHFHFIFKQLVDGGIAKFMQKLQGGYTYYFNVKNSRSGSLFQGTFKSHLINDENYFNKIIAYVNKNYKIHNIPKNKNHLVFSSDYEYENNNFTIVSKKEGERILEIFNGKNNFIKHCNEIVSIIRNERNEIFLNKIEDLPQ